MRKRGVVTRVWNTKLSRSAAAASSSAITRSLCTRSLDRKYLASEGHDLIDFQPDQVSEERDALETHMRDCLGITDETRKSACEASIRF